MQKQAPSLGRILAMVVFALSCFGLLLFLWLSFGGPIPLQPQGYRFKASFREAATLAQEADVRIAGINAGKVRRKELQKRGASTLVTIEMDPEFAPIPADTRAILRQKTLLGETYVELSAGSGAAPKLPEGGTLARTSVEPSVELDEIYQAFDAETRRAFRAWQAGLAETIRGGRGQDLNDAFGNLADFVSDGADVLGVLDQQDAALRRLIKNTGVVFGALNEREGQLHDLVVNSNNVFEATASRDDALADTFAVFPTFLDESKSTLARLERFATDTRPLVVSLKQPADDLGPTLHDLGTLAPDLEQLFRDLDPLIRVSRTNLPQAVRFLNGAEPLFEGLHVFLPQLNPVLAFANYQQKILSGFISNGGAALNATLPALPGESPRHYLRQWGMINDRSPALNLSRPVYERGNAYGAPNYLSRAFALGTAESFDCPHGEVKDPVDGDGGEYPPCFVAPPSLFDGNKFPRLTKGKAPSKPAPDPAEGTEPAKVD